MLAFILDWSGPMEILIFRPKMVAKKIIISIVSSFKVEIVTNTKSNKGQSTPD
jgi:hypothetical protein